MVSRSSSRAFERWRLPIPASGARLSRDAADRLSDGCPSATAPLRRRESCGSLAAPRIFRNSQNWGLTGGACFRNILTCARRFRAVWRESSVGVSSNGRTAVSGAVCEGSTPSTPAIFTVYCTAHYVAPSSSGLGRRPLKAEVAGSNPVGATKESGPGGATSPGFMKRPCGSVV